MKCASKTGSKESGDLNLGGGPREGIQGYP
jgi:hypothetical protein